jgi:hypothetical protein
MPRLQAHDWRPALLVNSLAEPAQDRCNCSVLLLLPYTESIPWIHAAWHMRSYMGATCLACECIYIFVATRYVLVHWQDSTHFEKTMALLKKYDPEAQPPPRPLPQMTPSRGRWTVLGGDRCGRSASVHFIVGVDAQLTACGMVDRWSAIAAIGGYVVACHRVCIQHLCIACKRLVP